MRKWILLLLLGLSPFLIAQDDIDSIFSGSLFIERVNICAVPDLPGIVADDSFPDSYMLLGYAVWNQSMAYFLSDRCFWDYRCDPGHTLDGLSSSIMFRFAMDADGFAYCGVYTADTSAALFLLANKELRAVATWRRPLTPDDILTGAFYNLDYSQNFLAVILHHQYELVTERGHIISGALPILRDRLCLDSPTDSSGALLYGFNMLNFALKSNLTKTVWSIASQILIRPTDAAYSGCWYSGTPVIDGPTGRDFYYSNIRWCAMCADSLGLTSGTQSRGFYIHYTGAEKSAIRMSGGSNNLTEAWGYLNGIMRMHILNCCTRDFASANYYTFDAFPDSVRLVTYNNPSKGIRSSIRMAVLADSVWFSNIWESPAGGLDGNPAPLLLKISPGWNGDRYPEMELYSTTLDLGSCLVGDTLYGSFPLENIGTDDLIITTLEHRDTISYDVSYDVHTPPGMTGLIEVWLAPDTLGEFVDTIRFYTNVPCLPIIYLTVTGRGVLPLAVDIINPDSNSYVSCNDLPVPLRLHLNRGADSLPCYIDTSSIEFTVNGVLHSIGDGYLRLSDDSTLVFSPSGGELFFDAETVAVCLDYAEDECGNYLTEPFCWRFFVDLTPPLIQNITPLPNSRVLLHTPNVLFCLQDNLSGLDTSSIVITSNGDTISRSGYTMLWDGDSTCISFTSDYLNEGDTIVFCVSATDSTDYCDDNQLDTCWYLWFNGEAPEAYQILPSSWSYSSCSNQDIRIRLSDDDIGVDPSSIELSIDGVIFTVDSVELSFDPAESLLLWQPSYDYFSDGDTVSVILTRVTDYAGNELLNGVVWNFIVDLSAPFITITYPRDFHLIKDLTQRVELTISDILSGVDISSLAFVMNGDTLATTALRLTSSGNGYELIFDPSVYDIKFVPGDTAYFELVVTDTTDYCADNLLDTTFALDFEPTTYCSRYPNPATPNGDNINDVVIFNYPFMFSRQAHLEVYNRRRELVYDGNLGPVTLWSDLDALVWRCINNSGKTLSNGLYIYIIRGEDGEELCSGTISIVR